MQICLLGAWIEVKNVPVDVKGTYTEKCRTKFFTACLLFVSHLYSKSKSYLTNKLDEKITFKTFAMSFENIFEKLKTTPSEGVVQAKRSMSF